MGLNNLSVIKVCIRYFRMILNKKSKYGLKCVDKDWIYLCRCSQLYDSCAEWHVLFTMVHFKSFVWSSMKEISLFSIYLKIDYFYWVFSIKVKRKNDIFRIFNFQRDNIDTVVNRTVHFVKKGHLKLVLRLHVVFFDINKLRK